VIETCGVGKISQEEAILIADTSLNMCKIGLALLPIEFSGSFTSNAASLLCVLLTGPYASADLFIASILRLSN
jgi:hypothetical protein